MTLSELKTHKVGDTITVIGITRDEVEAKIVKIEKNLVTLDTTGTELDARRSQVDINNGIHQIEVYAKFLA